MQRKGVLIFSIKRSPCGKSVPRHSGQNAIAGWAKSIQPGIAEIPHLWEGCLNHQATRQFRIRRLRTGCRREYAPTDIGVEHARQYDSVAQCFGCSAWGVLVQAPALLLSNNYWIRHPDFSFPRWLKQLVDQWTPHVPVLKPEKCLIAPCRYSSGALCEQEMETSVLNSSGKSVQLSPVP